MELDPNVLHVAIRWVHVAAMATAFGGAITVLALSTRPGADSAEAVTAVAVRYEWLFWAAAGVLAMTGIGNLAAFGAALLGPATNWGATLLLKLGSVLALVAHTRRRAHQRYGRRDRTRLGHDAEKSVRSDHRGVRGDPRARSLARPWVAR